MGVGSSSEEDEVSQQVTVLVVEDEEHVAELYESVLSQEFSVIVAENGGEAMMELDDSVDVVLLDRRLPGMSGDDVLEQIESQDVGCRVAMVSAVDPDFDVIEMGFDDYLSKPVSKSKVVDTIDQLVLFDRYEKLLTEYHSLTKAYATLKSNLQGQPDTERLQELKADREAVREELEETIESFTDDIITDIFTEIHDIGK